MNLVEARKNFKRWQAAVKRKSDAIECGAPEVVLIVNDDWEAKFVGRTADGRQFFLTEGHLPKTQGEFLALYTFDLKGKLLEAQIDDFKRSEALNLQDRRQLREQRLLELGEVTFREIGVRPFFVERDGLPFGLIPRPPRDKDDDDWLAQVEPGNYMAFAPPWDCGNYDT
jgi:hypothetical protein